MGQIKSFIALSLDGFIASVDGELDWIPQSVRAIPKSLFENASCLLVGANTYDYLFEHLDGQVYKTKPIFMSFYIPIIIYSPIAIFHFLLKNHWMQ